MLENQPEYQNPTPGNRSDNEQTEHNSLKTDDQQPVTKNDFLEVSTR